MTRTSVLVGGLILAVSMGAGWIEGADQEVRARLGMLLERNAAEGVFSGVALVADASGVVLQEGYGYANLEWNIPNTPEVRYRVGSISKQFTAAVVMKLVEDGALSFDSTLTELLPWYRADTGSQVTIRQLLNHTSGIDRSGVPRMIAEHSCCPMPLLEEVTNYCSGDLEWQPGSKFAYNNAGYLILGAVIEEVTGVTYAEALQEKILAPVGMKDTGLDDPSVVLPRRAAGYDLTDEGIRTPSFVHATLASSAGGVYSTVGDLFLWDRALDSDDILAESTRRGMFTPGLGDYGYGWFIMDMPVGPDHAVRSVIRHPGQGDGFRSIFWRIPEDEITIILINNVGKPSLAAMAEGILDVLHGNETVAEEALSEAS